jgi:hypothetical protein
MYEIVVCSAPKFSGKYKSKELQFCHSTILKGKKKLAEHKLLAERKHSKLGWVIEIGRQVRLECPLLEWLHCICVVKVDIRAILPSEKK